jgi:hypothetical protein
LLTLWDDSKDGTIEQPVVVSGGVTLNRDGADPHVAYNASLLRSPQTRPLGYFFAIQAFVKEYHTSSHRRVLNEADSFNFTEQKFMLRHPPRRLQPLESSPIAILFFDIASC